MKTVYLLRHAKSSWKDAGLNDRDRPLNARGRDACVRLARYFAENGVRPRAVLCSTAERTRETLARCAAGLGEPADVRFMEDLYLASPQTILRAVARLDDAVDSVLVVGHYPGMPDVALLLGAATPAGETDDVGRAVAEKYPTGGFARVSLAVTRWRDAVPGSGTLDLFVRPKDLPEPA